MDVLVVTTEHSDRYHSSKDCPLFKSGQQGSAAAGYTVWPEQQVSVAEAIAAGKTACACARA